MPQRTLPTEFVKALSLTLAAGQVSDWRWSFAENSWRARSVLLYFSRADEAVLQDLTFSGALPDIYH